MVWSPIKRAGHKRLLEELEEGEVDPEEERAKEEESGEEEEEGDEQERGAVKVLGEGNSVREDNMGSPEGVPGAPRKEREGNMDRAGTNRQKSSY